MPENTLASDAMIDVFEFPHIPYWFSVKQAVKIIKKSILRSEKCIRPMAILVFDEKYNLVGVSALVDILNFLSPKMPRNDSSKDTNYPVQWETLIDKSFKEKAERPISEAMRPVNVYLEPGDNLLKAAYLMISNDMTMVPVLENSKKLVGVVRISDVFDHLSDRL